MFPSNLDFLLIFKADKNVSLHEHCLIMYAYTDSVGKYAMSLKLLRNTSNSGQFYNGPTCWRCMWEDRSLVCGVEALKIEWLGDNWLVWLFGWKVRRES